MADDMARARAYTDTLGTLDEARGNLLAAAQIYKQSEGENPPPSGRFIVPPGPRLKAAALRFVELGGARG